MQQNVLLTGRPGVGKSTIIAKALETTDVEAGGFYTQELEGDGRRLGFGITTLDGDEGVLAHVNIEGEPRVSKYGVNVDDIREVAVASLKRARKDAELIVCDEIARMELLCPEFAPMVRNCLDDTVLVLGTIQQRRDDFWDEIRERDDVRIVEVTEDNRSELPDKVAEWIQRACR